MTGPAVDGVVAAVRQQIFEGRVRPGQHLDEASLGRSLDVSRNTLREAFRVLAQQHLVVHEPNRGVFVRHLDARSAHDVYAARRHLECGALREAAVARLTRRAAGGPDTTDPTGHPTGAATGTATGVPAGRAPVAPAGPADPADPADPDVWAQRVAAVRAAVAAGRAAADAEDWMTVGSANSRFHVAVAALAGNAVVDRMVDQLLTEVRLLFVDVASAREVHETYLAINERIAALLEADELVRAAVVLEDYLFRAESDLVGRLTPCQSC